MLAVQVDVLNEPADAQSAKRSALVRPSLFSVRANLESQADEPIPQNLAWQHLARRDFVDVHLSLGNGDARFASAVVRLRGWL